MMNTDKAYIIGLVVGGGSFGSATDSFSIKLPYKQWGDVSKNPGRAGEIANDIVRAVSPVMKSEYGLTVTFETKPVWRIVCLGDLTAIIADLKSYGINPAVEIRKNADISKLVPALVDDNLKRRFVAGVADTIGSMAPSQRRFSDDVSIISFEINGFAFRFVSQLCNLLYSLGCLPDQILWQQPNMQSGNDAYYTQWKKGNKLRVTLDAFSKFGALGFKSKAVASKENRAKQSKTNIAERCENKTITLNGVTAVHIDENHRELPDEIRGGHFIHHKQICAALGCPHAPYSQLDRLLAYAERYISPFTVLHKGESTEVSGIILADPLLRARTYTKYNMTVAEIVRAIENGKETVIFNGSSYSFSEGRKRGYPLNIMIDAIAFVIASKTGKLNGKRVRGSRDDLIADALKNNPSESVIVEAPELLTPLVVTDNKASAMVGPLNETVYKKLISFDPANKYKMKIRPITEADLR
jgi:hypothetical protein